MDAGQLVYDGIMLGMIRERLGHPTRRADSSSTDSREMSRRPRLARLLDEIGQPFDAVVLFDVDPMVLLRRLAGRRTCRHCGVSFTASRPAATR